MNPPRHPRVAEPTLCRHLPAGSPLAGRTVRDCLRQMDEQGVSVLPLTENGVVVATLSLEILQRDLIEYYEKIFHELELDKNIMFLQGTYSC
ncbi:MAG TPA: hypothetical protein HPQ04_12070 [Rhodospirillaceae bacterium]|nr:hypothetical protein [Rhodospirillaceae bacterium]